MYFWRVVEDTIFFYVHIKLSLTSRRTFIQAPENQTIADIYIYSFFHETRIQQHRQLNLLYYDVDGEEGGYVSSPSILSGIPRVHGAN